MMFGTEWLAQRFVPDRHNTQSQRVRTAYGALAAWVSVGLNGVLFVAKLAIGMAVGSIALIADAVHTVSDVGTSVVVLVGFRMAGTPSDERHPYGHGRAEQVATLIIAMVLVVVGFEFLRASMLRIVHPTPVRAAWWMIGLVAATGAAKEWLARLALDYGRRIGSDTLRADAWHHRTDVWATLLVAAALVSERFGLPRFDGYAGVVISLVIMVFGIRVAMRTIHPIIGERPSPEALRDINAIAVSVPGVVRVHDIGVHVYGRARMVSLHVEVPETLPSTQGHEIAEAVERAIEQKMDAQAIVHVDPTVTYSEEVAQVARVIKRAVAEDERILSFHDVRLIGEGPSRRVLFDLVLDRSVTPQESASVAEAVREKVQSAFPESDIELRVEPKYLY